MLFRSSGIGGIGDWSRVIEGFEPHLAYRVTLAVVGAALYFVVAPRLLMPSFGRLLNPGEPLPAQVRWLMLYPYLVGGTTYVLAGLLNPYGLKLVLISAAAASFGGTSLRAWYPADNKALPTGTVAGVPFAIARSKPWLAAAAVTLIVFIGILGPGLTL